VAVWRAPVYPSPLCWGASFDPELIERPGAHIGQLMKRLGVHESLAPVLDVVRDLRWGRTEETIGEDPYLVGLIGRAYVRGLESAGVVATLKHFVGSTRPTGAWWRPCERTAPGPRATGPQRFGSSRPRLPAGTDPGDRASAEP
jgi:beta-xylosidase